MRRWLDETAAVLGRRPRHEAALAATQARLASGPGAAEPSSASSSAHATVTDAWFAEQLGELLGDLTMLAAAEAGVRARLAFAESVERRTLEEPRAAWAAATAAVAADPRYGGLALAPQRGLIPLGADPASGLQEFAHLESGEPPRRDPATGALQLTAESGLVLVLIPGGTARAGCEPPGPDRPAGSPHTDPQAGQYDGPVQTVELDPYFIGKHELTQGQWLRHTGSNPSSYGPESKFTKDSEPLRHPVEAVSWIDADRVLRELGLLLPTEVQWEHAARAGTTTVWWTGDDRASVAGAANVSDEYARANGGHAQWDYEEGLDDGYTTHGPVGSLRANAFGLHDTMGNVSEWCRDTWEDWSLSHPRPGDGYCHDKEQAPVFRGGAYNNGLQKARSGVRDGLPADVAVYWLGLRAARQVDGLARSP
jgi:formylglycine-generating enzyme required for sulfatase activity